MAEIRFFDRLIVPLTWIMRVVTGAVFLFSSTVKAIDPWGSIYKFEEYFQVLGMQLPYNLLVTSVFVLCIYEFLIGIFLLTGSFRRSAPVMALVFMAVMLPLTLWIAIANPVDDCGCFGDALIIGNWETFFKNLILTAAFVWLLKFNTKARTLVLPAIQWILIVSSSAYVFVIGEIGYLTQPMIDFRKYPAGTVLADNSAVTESDSENDSEEDEMLFIYEKDGVEHKFSIDDELPDESDGWHFVRREMASAEPSGSGNSKIDNRENKEGSGDSGFRVWSGDEDVTDAVITSEGDVVLLLMPELDRVSIASTWKINSLCSWAMSHGADVYGIVAATPEEIENWRDLSLPSYPIYTAEDTQIKMLARGNPAVVYLHNGKIEWKNSLSGLPDDDFLVDDVNINPSDFKFDSGRRLFNITGIYIAVVMVLICMSMVPALTRLIRGDKAHCEESSSPDKSAQ